MPRKAQTDDAPPDVGSLIRASKLTREDVEAAAARLFDGKTPLSLNDEVALVMPDFHAMTVYSREAIMTALLLSETTPPEATDN